MNARIRKKWLKKNNKYVSMSELWNLDNSLAEYILPRLKKYKQINNGYPGVEPMETPEKWDEALDKMITAFEYIVQGDKWWMYNPKYDYTSGMHLSSEPADKEGYRRLIIDKEEWTKDVEAAHYAEEKRRQEVIDEGLALFGKWFQSLWI